MDKTKTIFLSGLLSVSTWASAAGLDEAADAELLKHSDPRLYSLIENAAPISSGNHVRIERWYDHPGIDTPTFVITETASNTDDAYEISESSRLLHELIMPSFDDDPYSLDMYPSDAGTQLVMRAKIDESSESQNDKPYARAYERTYETALNKFESNIIDIGRQVARIDSYEAGRLRFKQSWVSDSFRISRSEPPKHLIAADQIDNEFFSLRMTRWWNAEEYALHVDYYLMVRDVEVLPADEHKFHDAVVHAQNLLKFTVADQNEVVIAEVDQM